MKRKTKVLMKRKTKVPKNDKPKKLTPKEQFEYYKRTTLEAIKLAPPAPIFPLDEPEVACTLYCQRCKKYKVEIAFVPPTRWIYCSVCKTRTEFAPDLV
jgi:hypothetical protein